MAQIACYLHTYKALRAQLLLDEYVTVTPRNGHYTVEQRLRRELFEQRFFAISVRAPSRKIESVVCDSEPSRLPVINRQDET